jgi:CDP-diacylglycerol--glycerol-3-phosphate 3-phosphatidyltransferase
LAQPTSTWNPIRGKARSSYGATKVAKDSFSKLIAQKLGLPRFKARASDIRIIQSPAAFYDEIRAIISRAEQRIYLSSLYIGKNETELVSSRQAAATTMSGALHRR